MSDISDKNNSLRIAVASGQIYLAAAYQPAKENHLKKGDLISTATLSGIMAAKKTSDLIPLCHQLPLSSVHVDFCWMDTDHVLEIKTTVKTVASTGVEMEALTATSIALLTVYDMCKAITKDMEIKNVVLLEKSGGKSGDYKR